MAARSLTERVGILEQKVEELQRPPSRMAAVESQILQLRDEMHVEFSAIQDRLGAIDQRFEEVLTRLQEGDDKTRAQLHEDDEKTRRYMRMLHEEVLNRISLLQEGRGRRRR